MTAQELIRQLLEELPLCKGTPMIILTEEQLLLIADALKVPRPTEVKSGRPAA